jgi:hypothetical protein
MKTAAIPLFVAFELVSGVALAQTGASDPLTHLRACSLMERAARLECLEKLSRAIAPPDRRSAGDDNWVVSETTSPVDYTPIVTATTSSRGSTGALMQLSIRCRAGRTELVVAGPAVSRSSEEYAISYRINDDQPVHLAASSPSFGTGAAFTGDVVRLLQSLPEEGGLTIRLSARTGVAQEGYFLLGGLKMVREKVAAACKWPHAVAKPRSN